MSVAQQTAYLSLGSNLGDRAANLKRAVASLGDLLEGLATSSIYETLPMYLPDQPRFLNMVVSGRCSFTPKELLDRVRDLEGRLGRERSKGIPKGPRVIDIDILLYGERIIENEELVVPHPRMKERQFVLIPLLELNPHLRDPATGRPLAEALAALQDQGVYIFSR
jgi:2-amino-4-hydroxy-6-hydroxymethyldihydropteridine diphosphokinase